MNARRQPDRLWANLRTDADGLLPCVTQDLRSRAVLMVAWVSKEALERTLSTGYAVYYSRSRRQLWEKGATSGKRQRIVQVRLDSDADTLLYLVDALLPAAPDGNDTYFNFRQEHRTWIWDPIHLRDSDPLGQLLPPSPDRPRSTPPEAAPDPSLPPRDPDRRDPDRRDPTPAEGSHPTAIEPQTAEQPPSELRTDPPDAPPPGPRAPQRSTADDATTPKAPPALVRQAAEVCAQAEAGSPQLADACVALLQTLDQTLRPHGLRLNQLRTTDGSLASSLDKPNAD